MDHNITMFSLFLCSSPLIARHPFKRKSYLSKIAWISSLLPRLLSAHLCHLSETSSLLKASHSLSHTRTGLPEGAWSPTPFTYSVKHQCLAPTCDASFYTIFLFSLLLFNTYQQLPALTIYLVSCLSLIRR